MNRKAFNMNHDDINPDATESHPATFDRETLLRQCDVRRVRRSGPGGQRRNKVETGVVLRHRPTGVDAEASERRSVIENQRVALLRMRVNLALEIRRAVDDDAAPSALWRSRCPSGRISVNSEHWDFPALLAEALDSVFHFQMDVKSASGALGCTASQLIKFVKIEPRAVSLVNARRVELGMHQLK